MPFFKRKPIHPSPKTLRRQGHDSMELSKQAVKLTARYRLLWSRQQKDALRTWTTTFQQDCQTYVLLQAQLEMLLHLLDNIFFEGTIRRLCQIAYDTSPGEEFGVNGLTRFVPGQDVLIVLDPNATTAVGKPAFAKLVGLLLHEMCHAYHMLYACLGGCNIAGCESRAKIGLGGHGVAFVLLAKAVEKKANRILGFENVDLEIVEEH